MASKYTQLKGSAKLGPTTPGGLVEYNAAITAISFRNNRNEEVIPATLATGEDDIEAGTRVNTMIITVLTELAQTGLFSELEDAYETDDGELFFEVLLAPGAVGVDNPKITGKIVVDRVAVGGDVGKARSESYEYEVKAGTFAIATA